MPQTDKPTVVSQYIYDKLSDNAAMRDLDLEDVWDGDMDLIPRVPAVCVVQGDYTRAYAGIPFRTDNNFVIYLLVFHQGISDEQIFYRQCGLRAEAIMDFLHEDPTMGGNVINGYVTGMEPGYIQKRTKMFATRITWIGMTKTMIGAP